MISVNKQQVFVQSYRTFSSRESLGNNVKSNFTVEFQKCTVRLQQTYVKHKTAEQKCEKCIFENPEDLFSYLELSSLTTMWIFKFLNIPISIDKKNREFWNIIFDNFFRILEFQTQENMRKWILNDTHLCIII